MNEKKIVLWYLTGTFLLTYIMWGTIVAANQFGYLKYGTPLYMIIYAIGGLAPTIFGYIVSKKSNKIKGFTSFIKENLSLKQPLKYYALMLTFWGVCFGVPFLMHDIKISMAWYLGIPLIFVMIFFGGLEELGWRYTLQPALETQLPFSAASAITACFWALWHLPLFFIEGMNSGKSFGLFVIGVFGMAFILAAIFRVTKSLWLCILFHAMINAFSQVWVGSEGLLSTLIPAIVKIALSIAVVMVHNHITKVQHKHALHL